MNQSSFWPFPFFFSPYLQTIVPALIRGIPPIEFQREILPLTDGGTVALDWIETGTKKESECLPNSKDTTIFLCPGLTGTSATKYVLHVIQSLIEELHPDPLVQNLRIVVLNNRGLANNPLVTPKSYNGSETGDIGECVEHIVNLYPHTKLYAMGFSLGANLITKYIGEQGKNCKISAAMSVSNPFNFNKSVSYWKGWKFHTFLGSHLTKFLINSVTPNIPIFTKDPTLFPSLNSSLITSSKTLQEFDERFTVVVGGWNSLHDYYESASCEYYLPSIQTPMLFLNAQDDPLYHPKVLAEPINKIRQNPNLMMLLTPGEVIWVGALYFPHLGRVLWMKSHLYFSNI